MKKIVILNEPQPVSPDIMGSYFPEKIEISKGVIGWDKETQEKMFKVLAYNIGLKRVKEILAQNEIEKNEIEKNEL